MVLAGLMALSTVATVLFIQTRLEAKRADTVAEVVEGSPDAAAVKTETGDEPSIVTSAAAATPAPEAEPKQEAAFSGVVEPRRVTTLKVDADGSVVAGVEPDTLGHEDPRWLRDGEAPPAAKSTGKSGRASVVVAYADPDQDASAPSPDEDDTTAAIPPQDEPEVAPAASENSENGRSVRVGRAVNMRAGPGAGKRVLGVIPAGSTVSLYGCKGWCEVSYNGKRGFIYRSFLQGGGDTTTRRNTQKTRATNTQKLAQQQQQQPFQRIGSQR